MKPLIIHVPDNKGGAVSHVTIVAFSFKFKKLLEEAGLYAGHIYDPKATNNNNKRNHKKFNKRTNKSNSNKGVK